MKYQGAFDVIADSETKLISLKKLVNGQYTADTAASALQAAVEFATANKEYGFDRWDFYIPDVNQKLDFAEKRLPTAKVLKAVKDGFVPTVVPQKWGKPRIVIASPTSVKSTAAAKATTKIRL